MGESIEYKGKLLALVLRGERHPDGVKFITPSTNSLQLGILKHPRGAVVKAHAHRNQQRIIEDLQEVLHIKSGKVEFDFYDEHGGKVRSIVLSAGDTILLVSGGHGLNILEDTEMIEVKQGPYLGLDEDKRLF